LIGLERLSSWKVSKFHLVMVLLN